VRRPRPAIDAAAVLALILLGAITLLAAIVLWRTPSDPTLRVGRVLQPPDWRLPFGTDEIGRDLFSRVLSGVGHLWLPSVLAVAMSAGFGTLVGAVGGGAGGWTDALLHRLTGLFRAVPAAVAGIAAAGVFGLGPFGAAWVLALFWWPWYARLARGEVRRHRGQPYVDAARLGGVSAPRRLWRYMLPPALPEIAVSATLDLAQVVLVLALVSFLGLGNADPTAELGAMTAASLAYLPDLWRLPAAPAAAVFGLALAANIAGEVFRLRLDRA
jgi:peptide/nickel transport system permease protein